MKKNGKAKVVKEKQPPRRLSKEELIDKMYYYLNVQTTIVDQKEKQYKEFEKNPSLDKNGNPIKNPYLAEFNNQVDAVTRTSASIIRISGSDLEDEEGDQEVNKKFKELVD